MSYVEVVEKQAIITNEDFRVNAIEELLTPSELVLAPSVLQINTLPFLNQIRERLGNKIKINQIPEWMIGELVDGYNYVWFMGIYERGQRITALKYYDQYREALPDLDKIKDVSASPFAILNYGPNSEICDSWEEWDEFRQKLNNMGVGIILDYVPYQTALCHSDVNNNPLFYLSADRNLLESIGEFDKGAMRQFSRNRDGEKYLAFAKDGACLPPWIDCLQRNLADPNFQEKAGEEVLSIIQHCDGLRWDMAQLSLTRRYLEYWGWLLTEEQKEWLKNNQFVEKISRKIRSRAEEEDRSFIILGEAYGDDDHKELSTNLDGLYFEKLYKSLIDATRSGYSRNKVNPVLEEINNDYFGIKPVVYSENHDTNRAAEVFGGVEAATAVTVVTALSTRSYWLMHKGQEEGRRHKLPMQINRLPPRSHDIGNNNLEMDLIYKNLNKLRNSRVWQTGKHYLPEIYQLKTGDYSFLNIITQQADIPGEGGVIVGTNLCGIHNGMGMIRLPEGAKCAKVCDFWTGEEVEYFNNNGFIGIGINPWRSQLIFYEY